MKTLVCEGRCGAPWTEAYDAEVRLFVEDRQRRNLDRVADAARRLVHTPHVATGNRVGRRAREEYECLNCGTRRTFGWAADGVGPRVPWSTSVALLDDGE